MGGGRRFPYPKHIWTPSGGWWVTPENWKRNTVIVLILNFSIGFLGYTWGESKTIRYTRAPPPHEFVPISARGGAAAESHH